jgi:ATP-dependent Zn protease
MLTDIKISLGAYAAEKIKLGFTTSGVTADFANALYTAHSMVWRMGMGKSGLIGDFHALDSYSRRGRENLSMSEDTKTKLDNDVQQIMDSCLKEVEHLLRKEEPLLDRLSKELIAKDELNYDEIEAIFKEFGKTRPTL